MQTSRSMGLSPGRVARGRARLPAGVTGYGSRASARRGEAAKTIAGCGLAAARRIRSEAAGPPTILALDSVQQARRQLLAPKAHRTLRLVALVATVGALTQASATSGVDAMTWTGHEPLAIAAGVVAVGLLLTFGRTPRHERPPPRPGWTAVIALVLFLGALAVRSWHLEIRPAGINFDERVNGCVVLDILDGNGPGAALKSFIYGEEAGTFYLQAPFFKWLGPSVFSFRFPAALLGSLHAPAVYLLARGFASPVAAAAAGALCVFDPTDLYFSRQANSLSVAASAQALTWLFLWQILRRRRTGGPTDETGTAWPWYGALALVVAAGLHTYPAFRLMPCAVLSVLVLFAAGNRGAARAERFGGPALVLGCVLLTLTPFYVDYDAQEYWKQHLQHVTTLSEGAGQILATAAERLPDTLRILLGLGPSSEGSTLFPGALVALMVAGALLALSGHAGATRSDSGRSWTARWFLLLLLAVGLAAPSIVRLEPFHTRRYLLMLTPAYVLLAAGLDGLLRLADHPRARGGWVGAAVLATIFILIGPMTFEEIAWRSRYQDAFEPRMRLLRSACRLARSQSVIVSRSTVRMPSALGHQDASPEFTFLLRGFGVRVERGLNVFPVFPVDSELSYALDDDNYWLPFLQRAFPAGREEQWRDPDCEDYGLHLYRVSAVEARRKQGLLLSSTAPGGRGRELPVSGLSAKTLLLPPGHRLAWRGALYVPASGMWRFAASAPRGVVVEVGSVVWNIPAGGQGPVRWLAEGWHFFRLTMSSGRNLVSAPSFRWALEKAPLAEIPDWHFLQELPLEPQFVAREIVGEPLAVASLESRFKEQPEIENVQMAALQAGDHIYTLMGGRQPLACFEVGGTAAAWWKGLRDHEGRQLQFPVDADFRRFNLSMTADPDSGTLYLAIGAERRLLRVRPDGLVEGDRVLGGEELGPTGISFDAATRTLVCAAPSAGQILRFDTELRLVSRLSCPGVTAVRPSPDGRVLYAVVPPRGGLVLLSSTGAEVGFWRCTEVTGLTRLTCDPEGRVFLSQSEGRLMGFSKTGNVIVPMLKLPNPPRDFPDEPPPMFSGIQATGAGELLLSISAQDAGWLRVRLKRACEAPATPPKDFRMLDGQRLPLHTR